MVKFFKYLSLSLAALLILGTVSVVGLYFYVKPELPSVNTLRDVRLQTPMQVYTADGKLISQFGEQRRIPLKLDEIPQQLIDAVIATEDSRFYEHFGVDPIGVMRAFSVLVSSGEIREGASTITMQLARNFFLTRERAWMRKIKEAFIALHIEQLLSKDEILELYLNKLELGHRAFGVGAAAQVYYGRDIHQLSLAEIATIAGLPKGPSILNPISDPQASVERRRIVLRRMLDTGKISQTAYRAAFNAPVTARYHVAEIEVNAPYLAEMVRQRIIDQFGIDEAYNSGLRVFTTVTAEQQSAAEEALRENLHAYDERHGYRGPTMRLWGENFRNDDRVIQQEPDEQTQALMEKYNGQPWSESDIYAHLRRQPRYGWLIPAVVLQVGEQSAQVMDRAGTTHELPWHAIDWARRYITNERQGFPPETAGDILAEGDQIWLRPAGDEMKLAQIPGPESALVALNPTDGAIQSVVGGYSFSMSQYNRATQAKRQVGSTIKPLIYAAALDNGFTLANVVNDAPITQWNPGSGITWRPRNSPEVYDGPIRLREALARSKNVVSVRLIRSVGVDRTADYLMRFGFHPDEIPRNESLSLGSASFTPMEMTRAFAVFANGGYLIEPYFISHVENSDGGVIFTETPMVSCAECKLEELGFDQGDPDAPLVFQAPQVISEQVAYLVTQALTSAVWGGGSWQHQTGWNGTAWRAQALNNRNIAGKTGTTNDVKDTWFIGYSSGTVAASWVGFDDTDNQLGRATLNASLGRDRQPIVGSEAGATTALPGWVRYMETALPLVESEPFSLPPDIVSVRIDQNSGKLSNRSDHTSRFEYFIVGTEPDEFADDGANDVEVFEVDESGVFN